MVCSIWAFPLVKGALVFFFFLYISMLTLSHRVAVFVEKRNGIKKKKSSLLRKICARRLPTEKKKNKKKRNNDRHETRTLVREARVFIAFFSFPPASSSLSFLVLTGQTPLFLLFSLDQGAKITPTERNMSKKAPEWYFHTLERHETHRFKNT